jgi:hypothetical protein
MDRKGWVTKPGARLPGDSAHEDRKTSHRGRGPRFFERAIGQG